MDTRLQPAGESSARFTAMERSAGVVFGVVLVSSAACVALFRLNSWFIFGSVLAGGVAYWCWRATLANKFELAAVAAVGALVVSLFAAAPELSRPLPVLLSSGISLLGVGLYASILIGRVVKRNRENEA
ncbi:hypothetical protein [Ramlibacter sp. WS9]|uniref:hypothetical protein n=1 Tax=Ramlibacter sp. WS9 TaxID=1882741 RepID=UPI001141FDED|nr:hypothetical protein [Ramlibacter sp. WS9]